MKLQIDQFLFERRSGRSHAVPCLGRGKKTGRKDLPVGGQTGNNGEQFRAAAATLQCPLDGCERPVYLGSTHSKNGSLAVDGEEAILVKRVAIFSLPYHRGVSAELQVGCLSRFEVLLENIARSRNKFESLGVDIPIDVFQIILIANKDCVQDLLAVPGILSAE